MDSQCNVAKVNNNNRIISSCKEIRRKVKNSKSIALKRYKIDSYNIQELDKVLNDVYISIQPVSADYDTRKDLLKTLNAMALDIYGKDSSPVLEPYGSFVMGMFSLESDLDVSINFGNRTSKFPRKKKIQVLERFAEKLHSLDGQGIVKNVESIFGAMVPIVKFVDQGTAVECDLSVKNKDGILKSQIIRIISQMDDRFQKLCMLVKQWAKAHEVNSALHRTLNSVSITLLVAHHLQTQNPPILPPFSTLFKDGMDLPNVEKRTQKFIKWASRNQESLGSLFATFFIKLQSVEFLWGEGLCASVLKGLWISKKWKRAVVGSISVEDFTDVSENFARRVNDKGAKKIYNSINRTVDDILEFLNGKVAGELLTHKLFGQQAVVESSFNGKIAGTHLKHNLFGQKAVVEPLPPVLPLNGMIGETDLKHSLIGEQATVEPPPVSPLNGKIAETDLKHSLIGEVAVVETPPVSPLNGKIAETHLKHSLIGEQAVVEPPVSPLNCKIAETDLKHSLIGKQATVEPPVSPLNGKIAETDLKHSLIGEQAVGEPEKAVVESPPSVPSLNGKITKTHLKQRLFGQQDFVEPPLPVLPQNVYPHQPYNHYRNKLNGRSEEYRNKRICLEKGYRAVGGTSHGREEIFENPRGLRYWYDRNCSDFEEFSETSYVSKLNGMVAGSHLNQRLFGQQAFVEPPPPSVLPHNVYPHQPHNHYRNEFNSHPEEYYNKRVCLEDGYRAVGRTSHRIEEIVETPRGKRNRYAGNFNDFEEFHETPPVPSLNGMISRTHLKHSLFGQQAVAEPPPPFLPLNYRNEFSGHAEEHHDRRVCLDNGYRAVGGTSHGREDIYENPRGQRNWYAENWNGLEEFHEIPRFEIHNRPLDDPYRHALNIGANGHLVHHRHDGRFSGKESVHVGLWHDYSRRFDLPAPPPPPYDRVSYVNLGRQNLPQPYCGRQFYR